MSNNLWRSEKQSIRCICHSADITLKIHESWITRLNDELLAEYIPETNYPTPNLCLKTSHLRWFSVLGRIPRFITNPLFKRIMWPNIVSSVDSSVSTFPRHAAEGPNSWRRFSHIIRLNTGFIPKRGIRLYRHKNYPPQTCNSSQTDHSSLI